MRLKFLSEFHCNLLSFGYGGKNPADFSATYHSQTRYGQFKFYSMDLIIISLLLLFFVGMPIYYIRQGYKSKGREIETRKIREKEKREFDLEKELKLEGNLKKVDQLQSNLNEVTKIQVPQALSYKKIIVDKEKELVQMGGDSLLYDFFQISSYLSNFRDDIENGIIELKSILNPAELKRAIVSEHKIVSAEKTKEQIEDLLAELDGLEGKGFNSRMKKLFKLGETLKPWYENQIAKLEFYESMACAMVVYYLNDKKLRYFEIYKAFEKLGVFDNTWQKNVASKLDKIDDRLLYMTNQIGNQLAELNQNFVSLSNSSEAIVGELKEINNGIMDSNLLQAVTVYQTWKINKNTKSIRN